MINLGAGVRTSAAYILATLTGYLGYRAHVPLAWMLGPLLVAACLSIIGVNLRPHVNLRRLGQLTIGVAVGLNMSAPVLIELARWFPYMVASGLFSILVACVTGVFLSRKTGLDEKTSFFASLPGGLAEMANIGVRMGARPEPIAIVQTLRVTLVVLIAPPILLLLGSPDFASSPSKDVLALYWAPMLVLGGAIMAYILALIRLNNPYMIGAVLFTTFFAANGIVSGRLPQALFWIAQLLIGFAVGCRFKREMLVSLPLVTFFGTISIVAMVIVMACFGLGMSQLTGLDYPSSVLSTSPGGMAEMAATAQTLHLSISTVVAFQVVRGLMVNGLASHYFAFLTHIGFLPFLHRLLGGSRTD